MRAAAMSSPGAFTAGDRAALHFTVDAEHVLQVRRALITACGNSVELLRTEIVPRSSRVRVYFVVDETAVNDAMLAVVGAVRRGEIGRVTRKRV